ncbi:hypothetical protein CASFOL_036280 [Castilleja foliolosa]|uniref:Uncharacterized protein n=1 Tax=Castilleja foliolosa TaxID=1961234 RepID=A0ABD3BV92_9LAMI
MAGVREIVVSPKRYSRVASCEQIYDVFGEAAPQSIVIYRLINEIWCS